MTESAVVGMEATYYIRIGRSAMTGSRAATRLSRWRPDKVICRVATMGGW